MGNGKIIPYVQPVYDLKVKRVIGAELLARWFSDGTVYAPEFFIPRLEKGGLIHRLDAYIFEQSCCMLERWHTLYPSLLLSVNQAQISIDQPDYVRRLKEMAGRYHFDFGRLIVEFTESTLCCHESLPTVVDELRHFGFQVAVDDFGSGWSSLGLLARVQVDWLKLDQCFQDSSHAKRNRILLENSMALARALGIQVVCEGVETKEQEEFLKSIDCTFAQGYLFGRPMPIGQFEAVLDAPNVPVTVASANSV